MNKITIFVIIGIVMFIGGIIVASPSQIVDAASPVVQLLTDPIFGLEEIKNEIIGIELRLDDIEDQLDRIEVAICVPTTEVCDALDNDCDGSVDEGIVIACGSNIGTCSQGTSTCTGGAFGSCIGETVPTTEVCDGLDNDCNGSTDEGDLCGANSICLGVDGCFFVGECGNGVVEGFEQCDDGNKVEDDDCTNSCTLGPG